MSFSRSSLVDDVSGRVALSGTTIVRGAAALMVTMPDGNTSSPYTYSGTFERTA